MIQDIFPHVFHNEYIQKKPSVDSLFLFYDGNQILLRTTVPGPDHKEETLVPESNMPESNIPESNTPESQAPEIDFYTCAMIRALLPAAADYIESNSIYLFAIDNQDFFLFADSPQKDPERQAPSHEELTGYLMTQAKAATDGSHAELKPLSILRSAVPRHLAFAGITGHQLHTWYQSRRFCGKCGMPLRHSEKERMMTCDHCHTMEYPVICPAVIVAVTHGDQLLLTKYQGRDYKRYALIAGYGEIGETIEETVHREVMEEVGLKVKNIRYYKSQPWSFSGTLLLGFFCELDGSDAITLDREELSTAVWFNRDDIPDDHENVSLTWEMMRLFKTSRQ